MIKPIPNYLKLHIEDSAPSEVPAEGDSPSLREYRRCFEEATGWELQLEQVDNLLEWLDTDVPPGDVEPVPFSLKPAPFETGASESSAAAKPIALEKARQLADAVSGLAHELQVTRQELLRREAELAAGIPVAPRADEETHLAVRLEAILKGGAKAVGCQAAALYLLDDATTQLKMRACWGFPKTALMAPARPLRGAVADLEALVGQAVVLEDTTLLPHWKVPESFASAVCVPVSSPTEPLGTLWFFGEQVRKYNDDETNLVEIIAGRVASELQRETLLNECVSSSKLQGELRRAAQWQQARLPNIQPLLDDWEVAGWSSTDHVLGSTFHEWFVPADGSLAIAVGAAEGSFMEAALTAASLHTTVRAHSAYPHQAAQMVTRANETFWNSSAGGQFASLFYGLIQPESGECTWSQAGRILAFRLGARDCVRLTRQTPFLGAELDERGQQDECQIEPGDLLLLANQSLLGPAPEAADQFSAWLARTREKSAETSAEQMLEMARLQLAGKSELNLDGSLLVVRRRSRSG